MKYYFRCPKCQNDEDFRIPEESSEDRGLGLLLLLFSLFWFLIYWSSRTQKIQCCKCHYLFRQPPLPSTSLSKLACSVVFIILIFGVIIFIIGLFPEITTLIPESENLSILVRFVEGNAKPIVILIPLMLLLITFSCLISAIVSDYYAHKQLKKTFKIKPEKYK